MAFYRPRIRAPFRPRFRSGRKSRSDLVPLSLCGVVIPVDGNPAHTSCDQPLLDTDNSFTLINFDNLTGALSPTEGTEAAPGAQHLSRGLRFRGMQFDLNILSNILFEQDSTGFIILTVRVAVILLDLDPTTGSPLFTSNSGPTVNLFTNKEISQGDILWRSQFHVPVIHTIRSASTYFSEDCVCYDNGLQRPQHARVRIRTRRNLKENQGLFLLWETWNPLDQPTAFVFDLFGFAAVKNWM